MTIVWDQTGDKVYEVGVDHGVLYVDQLPGVPWNGLISVDAKDSGDTPQSYYLDGVKFLVKPQPTDFEATITAFTYPDEFLACEGIEDLDGIEITEQPVVPFDLSYRTLIGNDVSDSLGYKIHLVYNAVVAPTDKTYSTVTDSPSILTFSWDIVTTPEAMGFRRPTAHYIFDSTKVGSFGLAVLESVLYGVSADPRIPTPDEIGLFPWDARAIIVIQYPDPSLLPANAKPGDLVFAISNENAYSVDGSPSPDNRQVIVVDSADVSMITSQAYPGDLVYDESTGILYRLGG